MKKLLLILLVLAGSASAQYDETPYKFGCSGNSYRGTNNVTASWIARIYDRNNAGINDWPGVFEEAVALCQANSKPFILGIYASSQEINLYEGLNATESYNTRLADTATHWQYIYAKAYMDSIGVSPESLVVHIADDQLSISNSDWTRYWYGGSWDFDSLTYCPTEYDPVSEEDTNLCDSVTDYRDITFAGLSHAQKRFSYQYWSNTTGDTGFFPAGYVWLANGNNADARRAIAYAYRRHFIEDSASYGDGKYMYTSYFMDNQQRYGQMARMNSYYTVNSSSGGPSATMDWVERSDMETDAASIAYFDESTRRIDSAIVSVLDSTTDAEGLDRIYGFANASHGSKGPTDIPYYLDYVNAISFELPIEPGQDPKVCRNIFAVADTLADHPGIKVNYLLNYDVTCSTNPSAWNFDSARMAMTHYCWWLMLRDTNVYIGPYKFNDTTRFFDIYRVDFGEPDTSITWDNVLYSYTGNGEYGATPYIYTMIWHYDDSSAVFVVRSSAGSPGYTTDSVLVQLGGTYYEVSADADTSETPVTSTYMFPYQGKAFVGSAGAAEPSGTGKRIKLRKS